MKQQPPVVDPYAGSPLEIVNKIMLSGEFMPEIDGKPVGEGEVVIEELTLFEKSVRTALGKVSAEYNALAKSVMEEPSKKSPMLLIYHEQLELFEKLFWTSIRYRLATLGVDCGSIGIREGYKIVQLPSKAESIGIHAIGLEQLFFSSMMGTMFAGSLGDLCAECPDHETCERAPQD